MIKDIPLELSFHNMASSDALKAAVREHVNKLEQFHDHIIFNVMKKHCDASIFSNYFFTFLRTDIFLLSPFCRLFDGILCKFI